MNNFKKSIEENIKKIDKLIVLSQVSRNKRLMLITLEEIEKVMKKELELFSNSKISRNEIEKIKELLRITKAHKESPMEFMKEDEIIILSKNQEITKISMKKLTDFSNLLKIIFENAK